MLLSTEKIQDFLRVGAVIKPNILYQSLDHILIESTGESIVFTKTNNNIFCRYHYEDAQSPARFLVPEQLLQGFVIDLAANIFELTATDNCVILNCGTKVNKCALQPVEQFPNMPAPQYAETVQFDAPLIESIAIARTYVSTQKNVTAANFVNIGSNGVFASDQSFVYYKAFAVPFIGNIFLDADAATIVTAMGACEYGSGNNYDFFTKPGVEFAYIKYAIQPINYAPMLALNGSAGFTVQKQELINYCAWVGYTAKEDWPIAQWHADNGRLLLGYNDANFNRQANTDVPVTTVGDVAAFKFCAPRLRAALAVLPYNKLSFINIGSHYRITCDEDPDYIGIIAGLA